MKLCGLFLLACSVLSAQPALESAPPSSKPAQRVFILKVDGLPFDAINKGAGNASLPWIKRVFVDHGTTLSNFYVRGISLSAPSWSVLDTGQHLAIRGNAEFNRAYPRVYDYLNFFPFYLNYARLRRADMPGVEMLDQLGIPLLIDQFAPDARFQSMQTYQRGVRWETLKRTLTGRFTRPLGELLSEWQSGGLEFSTGIATQQERELVSALSDPKIRYLDYFFTDFDHTAHLTNDERSQTVALRRLDSLIGRIWTGIEGSPYPRETLFVVVSDHGINTQPGVYSQGYNLVRLLNSREGGAHHVITTRHPLTEYKLRGLDPFVSWVTNESDASTYLKDRPEYPTALLDPDGNERASLHLRNSDWNALQMSFEREDWTAVAPILDKHRQSWLAGSARLKEELQALGRAIVCMKKRLEQDPKKWTAEDRESGRALESRRRLAAVESWERDLTGYNTYLSTIEKLASWKQGDAPVTIPKGTMGEPNTIEDLRHYIAGTEGAGTSPGGFQTIDYFRLLTGIRVRNAIQKDLGNAPIDFVVAKMGPEQILLYRSEEQQAVLTWKQDGNQFLLRYVPSQGKWRAGLPLNLFEDTALQVSGDRSAWLSDWHSEEEWMRAIAGVTYSNGVVGLSEHFRTWAPQGAPELFRVADPQDWPILARFVERRKRDAEADLLIFASNHWNFNVRGFNPGGNHGSLLRVSTRSVLMLAGGPVPTGREVIGPYDSLNFVPTVLALMGRLEPGVFPAQPIREVVEH